MVEKKDGTETRKSVLISWILSYMLIMLIPIAFSGVVYWKTVGIIRRDMTETNSAALKQIQQTLDNYLHEIEQLSLRVNISPRVKTLMDVFSGGYQDGYPYDTVKNVLDMNTELSAYSLANRFIKDFFIVFRDGDFVWSSYSIFDKRTFFNQSLFAQRTTYEEWLKAMDGNYVNRYLGEGEGVITFVQSLPIGSPVSKANLVIQLDGNRIRDLIRDAGWYSDNTMYILDREDHVLLSTATGSQTRLADVRFASMPGDYGIIESGKQPGKQDQKYVVSYISSRQTAWKYVCVVPFSVFSEKVEYVKVLTLLGLFLCAFLEGIVAVYFLRRNYNPLNRVVSRLTTLSGLLYSREKNEFSFIHDSISRVYEEKETVSRELLRQNAAIRSNIVLKLLKGRYDAPSADGDALKAYGISFATDHFLVALFYAAGPERGGEERMGEIQRVVASVLRDVAEDSFRSYTAESDELIAAVLNFQQVPGSDWKADAAVVFRRLLDVLGEKDMDCRMAAGSVHETVKGIHQGYQEALDAMEYQLFEWGDRVVFYDDIRTVQKDTRNYSYTIETEQKLINSIMAGDFEKGRSILDDVFRDNFASRIAGVHLAKCLMIDVVGTFIKALNSRGLLKATQALEDRKLIQELYECRTLEEIRQKLLGFLKEICLYALESQEKQGNGRVIRKIESAVENNYSDVNLNVAKLADLMDRNPRYISYVYRKASGDSIVKLINRTRIRAAKELLRNGCSIQEAAKSVGYGDSNAFIRIFKKYEGVTPGQFRMIP